ncbi:hypothetical protein CC86DRAFT_421087 [Ophiobolus disseminans]|uniref:Uncharacterized protein n=1 Tax=Ophiobolus disseminans TaxID=1469910 RepID=A0A6A6ZVX0_9PLEO|nr:hypothetical protein CC86DRAFT_421087 [Ophiobolus disseminans]
MRLSSKHYSTQLLEIFFLFTAITKTEGYQISFYSNTGCRYNPISTQMQIPSQGCSTYQADKKSLSQNVVGDGSDKSYYLVYFWGNDCNPENIIKKEDLGPGYSSRCSDSSEGYGSFEVWDVCESKGCLE